LTITIIFLIATGLFALLYHNMIATVIVIDCNSSSVQCIVKLKLDAYAILQLGNEY